MSVVWGPLVLLGALVLLLPAQVAAQDSGLADADAGVLEAPVDLAPMQAAVTAQAPLLVLSEPAAPDSSGFGAIAVAPAPGARIPLDRLPSHVQRLDSADLHDQHALSLHDALNARLASVTINDVQSNPLQPDVQYRGFTASPLLGTPQGISVYQNGVRLNEPFGDVLQWDLLPLFAMQEVQVVPGGNPVYGLNALGGSLVLRMKDGFSAPGARVEASGGSFSRYRLSAEYGHSKDGWGGYAGASLFGEEGFRDKSHSDAQTLYADLRRRAAGYEFGVGLTLAASDLRGNGPAPVELLRQSRSALYTWPDITQNELVLVSVDAQKQLAAKVALQGTLYLRHTTRATQNGDATDLRACAADGGEVVCDEEDEPVRTTIGTTVDAAPSYDSVFNNTHTVSNGFGATLQLGVKEPIAEHANQLIVGASYDGAQVSFGQSTQLGHLTYDREVAPDGPHIRGAGLETDLFVANHMLGVYAVDTFDLTRSLALHASARLNWYSTALNDRLGSALDGHHVFARVNPALGVTQRLGTALTLFASYGENNRAPSAAELACADPDEPCRLPNAFISDPPLKQVVSRNVELGLRTQVGSKPERAWLSGSIAAFGSRNHDDILFVAGSRVGTGYFRNAGETQRVGLELALRGEWGPVAWYAAYTLLHATFRSELTLPSAVGDDDDAVEADDAPRAQQEVEKGARIPGLPLHSVKAGVSVHITRALELALQLIGQSSQPYRGDEANERPFLEGYAVLNAQASYRVLPELSLFVRAQNLLDTNYSTFGVLANPGEVLPGASDPRFQGPGAPLGVWAGVVISEPRL
jgi:outer membrane receptor protein involved in Fe transport